ncbi:putative ORFan [Tupanvirus deep ocean]|uniref:ORFan n=2 Tax=Tupanvirus TaxID=2094720 RepID=A0AC62A993_9VIRU|nr:putative ORFan [Tupanvirus deep ocean]QKU34351.1 putative ORFan [Tupanvirus deep ocean]
MHPFLRSKKDTYQRQMLQRNYFAMQNKPLNKTKYLNPKKEINKIQFVIRATN